MFHSLRHNKRCKQQEQRVLGRGMTTPRPPIAAAAPLPEPRSLLPAPPTHSHVEHEYAAPANTEGQAVQRKRGAAAARALPVKSLHDLHCQSFFSRLSTSLLNLKFLSFFNPPNHHSYDPLL